MLENVFPVLIGGIHFWWYLKRAPFSWCLANYEENGSWLGRQAITKPKLITSQAKQRNVQLFFFCNNEHGSQLFINETEFSLLVSTSMARIHTANCLYWNLDHSPVFFLVHVGRELSEHKYRQDPAVAGRSCLEQKRLVAVLSTIPPRQLKRPESSSLPSLSAVSP